MKAIIVVFILLFPISSNVYSQASIFRMYRFECLELYNIKLAKPKGFNVIGNNPWLIINEKKSIGMFYRMTLKSKNKDCLILFPIFFSNSTIPTSAIKGLCYREVKAALNLDPENKTIELDSTKYLKVISKPDMKDYFNADTVFIYQFPLAKPYKEIYNHCIGINIIKKGHPSAIIKILLTEKGKKKEEEYMQTLFNTIHYNNIAPELTQEKIAKTIKKMKTRFRFSMKRYKYYGYSGPYDKARR